MVSNFIFSIKWCLQMKVLLSSLMPTVKVKCFQLCSLRSCLWLKLTSLSKHFLNPFTFPICWNSEVHIFSRLLVHLPFVVLNSLYLCFFCFHPTHLHLHRHGTCLFISIIHYMLSIDHIISQPLLLWQGHLALGSQTPRGPMGEIQGGYELRWENFFFI